MKFIFRLVLIFQFWIYGLGAVAEEPTISVRKAFQLQKEKKALILDIRQEEDLQKGLVKGALWVSLHSMEKNGKVWKKFLQKLPKDKELIVYSQNSAKSLKAQQKLESHGFQVAYFASFDDWVQAGLPIQKTP